MLDTFPPLVCYSGGVVGNELRESSQRIHSLDLFERLNTSAFTDALSIGEPASPAVVPVHLIAFPTEIQQIVHHKYSKSLMFY